MASYIPALENDNQKELFEHILVKEMGVYPIFNPIGLLET